MLQEVLVHFVTMVSWSQTLVEPIGVSDNWGLCPHRLICSILNIHGTITYDNAFLGSDFGNMAYLDRGK